MRIKVEFREGDAQIESVAEASVVCLYFFLRSMKSFQPMLQKRWKPGLRIVPHDFLLATIGKPEKEITVATSGQEHTLYLWTIKEKK